MSGKVETAFSKSGFFVRVWIHPKKQVEDVTYYNVGVEVKRHGSGLAVKTLPVIGNEARAISVAEGLVDDTLSIARQRYALLMAAPDAACSYLVG